jgi:hypothetical protein
VASSSRVSQENIVFMDGRGIPGGRGILWLRCADRRSGWQRRWLVAEIAKVDAGFITEVAEIGTQRTQRRAGASGGKRDSLAAVCGPSLRMAETLVSCGACKGGGGIYHRGRRDRNAEDTEKSRGIRREEGFFGCGVRKARAFATLGAQDRQNDRFVVGDRMAEGERLRSFTRMDRGLRMTVLWWGIKSALLLVRGC